MAMTSEAQLVNHGFQRNLRQVLQYGSDHMLRGEADEEHRAALFDLVFDSVE